jgi:hypothetical protein
MKDIETKITTAIENNKLNLLKLGERKWYNYFIRTTELVWSKNLHDGYQIEVYKEKYGEHLGTVII